MTLAITFNCSEEKCTSMYDRIREEVLKKIKPSPEEESAVDKLLTRLLNVAKSASGLNPVFVGSTGKGTWLSGDHDIDLFLPFHVDVSREDLERHGIAYGKKIASRMKGSTIIKYAEHPYTQANIEGYKVDIVPCYRIKRNEKIKSAVDRSPLHLEYVHQNLAPNAKDEVRLLKQFCKGISIYGSDTKTQGISGYICELLVIKYGRFENVLRNVSKWEMPVVIDTQNLAVSRDLHRKFRDSALIMVDPVDNERNAAANMSAENVNVLTEESKKYVSDPDKNAFFPLPAKELSTTETNALKKRETKFVIVRFPKIDDIDDVVYPQARRLLKNLISVLKHSDFSIIRAYEWIDKSIYFIIEFETFGLPLVNKITGPPVAETEHCKAFAKRYADESNASTYIEGNRWVAERRRAYREPEEVLKSIVGKTKTEMTEGGVPEKIAANFKKAVVLKDSEAFGEIRKNKDLSKFLKKKYFS